MGQPRDFKRTKNSDEKHDERKREFVRLKLNRKRSELVFGKPKGKILKKKMFV